MKIIYFIAILCVFLGCGNPYIQEEGVLYEGQNVAMPEYYRRITGYDSIQLIHYTKGSPLGNGGGGWEGNFCYPNKWQFEKFKRVKADSIVFKYDSIMVIHYNQSEVK